MTIVVRTLGIAAAMTVMSAGLTAAHAQENAAAFLGAWEANIDEGPVTLEFREGGEATGTQMGDTYQIQWAIGGADVLNGVEYTILEMAIIDGPKMYTRAVFEGTDVLVISEPEATLGPDFSDPITMRRTQ
ncbi:MAG: hypothetical protein AAF414_19560 [Pseudomonadota bacterium]